MYKQACWLGVLTSASLVASALALPLAAQAAPGGTELTVFVSDQDGDGSYGLYTRTAPGATPVAVVPESDALDVAEAATSADGSRIVTVEDTYPATGDSHERVVVRDLSGRVVRVVADVDTDTTSTLLFAASLSPDGAAVVWSQATFGGPTEPPVLWLRKAAVAGGDAATVAGSLGLSSAAFLDATTLVADSAQGRDPATIPLAGGSPTQLTGIPAGATDFTVSPDGTRLAWSEDTTAVDAPAGTPDTADIAFAPFTVTGGVTSLGTTSSVATGLNNIGPAWSADGTFLRYVKNDGQGGNGDLWSATTSGTSAPESTTPTADESAVATGFNDGVAPAAATALPFALGNNANATLAWTLPSDADLAGVVITRSPGAIPVYVPAPATHYAVGGLPLGTTFTYTITAVDRAGNLAAAVPAASRSLSAVHVAPALSSPTSSRTTTAPFPVGFGTAAAFTVDYSTNGGPYTRWVTQRVGSKRPFGLPSSGAAATTSTPGSTYTFRITAFDAYGNAGSPLVTGPAVVPYDQTRAGFSKGSYTYVSKDRWLGSVAVLPFAGATAQTTLTGNQLQVVGDRCPTCGVLDVYVNGVRVGAVDSYARTRVVRATLFTYAFPSTAARTFAIRARGTAGRPAVVVDGFAVRR